MGLCESAEVKGGRLRNDDIEKQLAESIRLLKRTQKLLLLGAAECGKSTILKQMRIIHDNGFSDEEIYALRYVLRDNMLGAMNILLTQKNHLGVVPTDYRTQINERVVRELSGFVEDVGELIFSAELYDALKQLWADQSIQEVYRRRASFHLADSAKYFFDNLDKFATRNYVLSNQDVLLLRAPTSGVTETKFKAQNYTFRVFDVGGQRSERRKWIHCFDNVNAIIFLSAINEFDQKLVEDDQTNRLLESLNLFEQIVNNSLFHDNCPMILFLNKTDLFEEKIKKATIITAFPNYSGSKTFEAQMKFIEKEFKSTNRNPKKKIYVHRTCATDKNQVQAVIESVFHKIIDDNVKATGLM